MKISICNPVFLKKTEPIRACAREIVNEELIFFKLKQQILDLTFDKNML